MGRGTMIPDRRRRHFPLNGGPRPSPDAVDAAHEGLDAARRVLAETEPNGPLPPRTQRAIDSEQLARARRGLARAREALEQTASH